MRLETSISTPWLTLQCSPMAPPATGNPFSSIRRPDTVNDGPRNIVTEISVFVWPAATAIGLASVRLVVEG